MKKQSLLLISFFLYSCLFAQNIVTIAGTNSGMAGNGGPANAISIIPSGVAVDTSGNVYISCRGNNFVVRKISASTGIITTVAGTGISGYTGNGGPATSATLGFTAGIALDRSGNIYIADAGNNVIRKVTAATGIITTVAGTGVQGVSGDGGLSTAAQFNQPGSVYVDSIGNIYIVDTYNHKIRKVNAATGIVTTVAGNGISGYAGNGSQATSARLNFPNSIAVDRNGNFYIGDGYNYCVRKVTVASGIITTIAGNDTLGYRGDGGPATMAELAGDGVWLDHSGTNLYIADDFNARIRKVALSTGIITTIAGTGVKAYEGDGGPAVSAKLYEPARGTIDINGNMYIADYTTQVIRKIDATTNTISTIAGNGHLRYSGDGGPASASQLWTPEGVTLDRSGNIYIADFTNNAIRKINAGSNIITTIAGTGLQVDSGDGGLATSASLYDPLAIAVDTNYDVYIACRSGNKVRKISASTGIITTIAGNGTAGFSGDGGQATASVLNAPAGLALDGRGNLYIADRLNYRVRKIVLATGVISTIAGTGTASNTGDGGPAALATFLGPQGLATDISGNLYISDISANVVRKITVSTGVISKVAGTGVYGFSGDGGQATAAQMNGPDGLAVDGSGNIFIADLLNARIRKVTVGSGIISTYAGSGAGSYSGDGGPATSAGLSAFAVAVDGAGSVYIADGDNDRLRQVLVPCQPAVTIAATATTVCGTTDTFTAGPVNGGNSPSYQWHKNASLVGTNSPTFISNTINNNDSIWVVMTSNAACATTTTATSAHIKVTTSAIPATPSVTTTGTCVGATLTLSSVSGASQVKWYWGGSLVNTYNSILTATIAGGGNGAGSGANQLNQPMMLKVDASGNIYVTDYTNNRVQKFPSGSTSATNATTVAGGNGPGTGANQLNAPRGITFDASGRLFIAEEFNNRVQRFPSGSTSSSNATTVAGSGYGTGATKFEYPRGVVVDASGNIYVADANNHRVQKFPAGSTSSTSGVTVAGGNGSGSAANQVDLPDGIVVDASGNLYVSDGLHNRVMKFPAGSTSATNGVIVAGGNGQGNAANQLYLPTGLYMDGAGNLYVADLGNYRVLKFPAGSTSATNGITVAGGNGYGSGLTQSDPYDVFVDAGGFVYTANHDFNRVEKWAPAAPQTTYLPFTSGSYTAVLVSAAGCTSAPTSPVVLNPTVVPSVSISASSSTICSSIIDTFTATPVNGGSTPSYQWYKNGVAIGNNAPRYITNSLNNHDSVWVVMTSSAPCPSPATAVSGKRKIIVIPTPTSSLIDTIVQGASFSVGPYTHGASGTYIDTLRGLSASGCDSIVTLHLTVVQLPAITSFSPSSGPIGTLVTITGSNLNGTTVISIGMADAISISNNGSTLVAMVMPNAVTGPVSVSTAFGTATSVASFSVTPTPYPAQQQGGKLVGTGSSYALQRQGYAVAVSADGNTAIVGGYTDSITIGSVWIFVRSGGVWTQQGPRLKANDAVNANQGWAVAISADGNTALVGGRNDLSNRGAAWIYTRAGTTWFQQGSKLIGTGAIGSSQQGIAVALSADGNTAVIGGAGDSSSRGATWIFTRSGAAWSQQGSKLVGSGSFTSGDGQGSSVAISADGKTLAIAGPGYNSQLGAVWIFTHSGNAWTQQGNRLIGTGGVGTSEMGTALALSADGNTLIAGGHWDNSNTGATWIFTRSGNTWSQQGSKIVASGSTAPSGQGAGVAISADGNTALIGAYAQDNGLGAMWSFTRSGSTWTQRAKLQGSGNIGNASQGQGVAMSSDGRTSVLGGYEDNLGIGATWAFIPCDSFVTPMVSISRTGACGHRDTFTASVANSGSLPVYQWYKNGTTVSNAAIYTDTSLAVNDSIWVVMTSNAPCASPTAVTSNNIKIISTSGGSTTITQSICLGSSYGGHNTNGIYSDTFQTGGGCDSIRVLHLTVMPWSYDTIHHTICAGGSYLGHTATGIFNDTLTGTNTCDSILTIFLTVIPNASSIITQTICQGSSYAGYTSSGSYTDHFTSAAGCDSARTLILTVTPNATSTISQTICQGSSYAGYTSSGTYTDHFTSAAGCDSARTLILTVAPNASATISQTICQGSNYAGHTSSGTYTDHFTSAAGCDSVRTLILMVTPNVNSTISQTICQGSSYAGYTSSGTYTDHFTSAAGCDSARTLILSVTPNASSTISQTICQGSSYAGYTSSGTYTDHFTSAAGCDSVRTLILSVTPNASSTISQTICQGSSYAGYTSSGTYTDHFTSAAGCDSARTLILTVTPNASATISQTICQGSSYAGYTSSGTYTDHFTSAAGCDSVRTLILMVTPNVTSTISQTICQGSSYAGYTSSGTYTDHFTSAAGCDSVRTLILTVTPNVNSTISQTVCQGSNYAGHTSAGTYTDHFTSAAGCDSVRTLILTVTPNVNSTISQTICQGSSYAGYTSSGTYTDHFTSAAGCDSARTLILTVTPNVTSTISQTICQGSSYAGYTSSGTYTDHFNSAAGCDSARTLILTVTPHVTSTISQTICQGSNYAGYTSSGTYTDHFTSTAGCDSVRTLILMVTPNVNSTISQTICQGSNYAGHTSSGTYTDHFTSAAGCDSARTLILSVTPNASSTISQTICQGSSYAGYTSFGTYIDHFTSAAGCDSARTLILNVTNNITSTVTQSICQGGSYAGHLATGTYTDHYSSAGGCDSSRVLLLTVNPIATRTITASITSGSSYTVGTQTFSNAGIYTITLSGAAMTGCDSIVTLHLTVTTCTPSVSITSTGIASCTSITFTATPANSGASPSYQWFKNNIPVGTGTTYTVSSLSYNDSVWVRINAVTCGTLVRTALSNVIKITGISPSSPRVSIAANTTNLNAGIPIIFTATAVNAGSTQLYNWFRNGILISGVSRGLFSYGGAMGDGDQFYAILYTTACGGMQTAISDTITFTKAGSTAKEITSLIMPNQIGTSVINSSAATVTAVIPAGSRVSIHPTHITVSTYATYGPSAAINRDFTGPVTYSVTAQNGNIKVWTVTVTDPSGNKVNAHSGDIDGVNGKKLKLYPDPAQSYIVASAEGGIEAPVITILDMDGRVMYHQLLPVLPNMDHLIDVSGFAGGTYVLHLAIGSRVETKQFIVTK